MDIERFEKIMSEDTPGHWDGDNAMKGLIIIGKYILEDDIICGAEHDIIYSVGTEDLVDAGITEAEAMELRNLNWMIEYDCLACFV